MRSSVFAADVNGDGWVDEIVFGFPVSGSWRENRAARLEIGSSTAGAYGHQRSPALGTLGSVFRYRDPRDLLVRAGSFAEHLVDDQHPVPVHGLGIGDLDGDGGWT